MQTCMMQTTIVHLYLVDLIFDYRSHSLLTQYLNLHSKHTYTTCIHFYTINTSSCMIFNNIFEKKLHHVGPALHRTFPTTTALTLKSVKSLYAFLCLLFFTYSVNFKERVRLKTVSCIHGNSQNAF